MEDEPNAPRRAWQTEGEWLKLVERITAEEISVRRGRRVRRQWVWVGAAASVVLMLGASAIGAVRWRYHRSVFETATTQPGQRLLVRLADKSTVTLGPASTLRYDRLGRSREIMLDGLADFRVEHDPSHPFVVHAGTADIEDVGTEFVVRAYAGDSAVHVAVNAGVVSVANRAGDRGQLAVHAGEVAIVQGVKAALQVRDVNPAGYTTWIGGTLSFDDDTFTDVARELGRWFDVDIRIADSTLLTRRVTAIYNNPTLPSVLDALSASLGVRHTRSGRIVSFSVRSK
jgi:transmembrane sensor